MKIKMKSCINCKSLLSNSSTSCTKCGRKDLEKGFYTDGSHQSLLFNKQKSLIISKQSEGVHLNCPTCGADVYIKNRIGSVECSVCDDEIFSNGDSYYNNIDV